MQRLLVLAWHNVAPTPCFPSAPGAALRGLERQLRILRRIASVVPLEQGLSALAKGRPLPPRAVALTFDDGYRDNLELAVPLLSRLGLPASFYLVPGLLDRSATPWWEVVAWAFAAARRRAVEWGGGWWPTGPGPDGRRAAQGATDRLKRMDGPAREAELDQLVDALAPVGSPDDLGRLFLDWDGARRLSRRAHVGSHTLTHPILSRESHESQAAQLAMSRERLEGGLDCEIRTLAYPNGGEDDYDGATLAAAGAAGYRFCLTTRRGWNEAGTPPFEIRRFVLDPARGWHGLRPILRHPGVSGFATGR